MSKYGLAGSSIDGGRSSFYRQGRQTTKIDRRDREFPRCCGSHSEVGRYFGKTSFAAIEPPACDFTGRTDNGPVAPRPLQWSKYEVADQVSIFVEMTGAHFARR